LMLFAGGCSTLGQAVKAGGQLTGYQDLAEAGDSLEKASRDFTEEEKYYIGRTVAATLLADFPWKSEARLTDYVNRVGSTLALASARPEMFRGYHFAVLVGKDANAFACPGGFVFVSTGLLAICQSEDELAAAMAHEIAHMVLEHPLQAISDSHQREAWASLAKFGLRKAGESQNELQQLSGLFDNVVKDVVKAVAQGYSRDKEQAADLLAADILIQAGYHPQALAGLLGRMEGHSGYHGDPKERARKVMEVLAARTTPAQAPERDLRFRQISKNQ